jgi:hypothetical protein
MDKLTEENFCADLSANQHHKPCVQVLARPLAECETTDTLQHGYGLSALLLQSWSSTHESYNQRATEHESASAENCRDA